MDLVIDAYTFARSSCERSGSFPLLDLPELSSSPLLFSREGCVNWQAVGCVSSAVYCEWLELNQGDSLNLSHLIQEEIILSMPMVPRHPPNDNRCKVVEVYASAPSPFAVLASLKQGH